jgi:hypothetical protein
MFSVEASRDRGFLCIDVEGGPLREEGDFVGLDFEVFYRVGQDIEVIGICEGGKVIWGSKRVRLRAFVMVATVADVEPAKERFKKDNEQEGGKGVTLDGTSVDWNWGCGSKGGRDCKLGIGVKVFDNFNGINWEAQIIHNLEKFVVVNHIKGT